MSATVALSALASRAAFETHSRAMYVEFKRNERDCRCRRCREPIEVGPWFVRAWVYTDPSMSDPEECAYHVECAIDVDAVSLARAFDEREGSPEELEPARLLARSRAKGIEALSAQRERGESAAPPATEPARDRKGRPRVRVRFGGSLSSGNTLRDECLEHMPDWTLCSSTREYVLAGSAMSSMNPRDDPSQPVVAALFATPLKTKVMAAQKDKLGAWRTEGLSTPVLWIVTLGSAPQSAIDAKFLELRALLAGVGYEADDAVTVCTETIDASAVSAVAAALDEHLARGASNDARSSVSLAQRAIALLSEAIESERAESWPSCLERAQRAIDSATFDERQQMAALAARCASDAESHPALLALAARAPTMTDPLHDAVVLALRASMATMKTKVPDAVQAACVVLERAFADERRRFEWVAIIEEALLAEKGASGRAEVLAAIIERAGDAASSARLRARAKAMRAGAARERVQRVIDAIDARLATR